MKHLLCGLAVTARYIPTNRIVKNPMAKEEFQKWEGEWYNKYSSEPYVEFLKPGSVVMLDVEGDGDTGSVGSFNSLLWVRRHKRDCFKQRHSGHRRNNKQKIPVCLDHMNRGRGIRPGRNEIESVKPVTIGGY